MYEELLELSNKKTHTYFFKRERFEDILPKKVWMANKHLKDAYHLIRKLDQNHSEIPLHTCLNDQN